MTNKGYGYLFEVCKHWSDTYACREHADLIRNYTKVKWAKANDGIMLSLQSLTRKQQPYSIRINNMIKELIHDPIFLARQSEIATKEDLWVAQDLLDTLMAHRESCVGMAANMIGVRKRIIVFDNEGTYMIMLNPEIIKNVRTV